MEVTPEDILTKSDGQWRFSVSVPEDEAQDVAEAIAYILQQHPFSRNRSSVIRRFLVEQVNKVKQDA